ncbi:MAG: photosystem II protein PsbQ [Pseudanabaenaceae cyanobacterium SKYGB_i_bin29]|nr:photosystem II protein PsbQ [Pseudanabaenaceae cyanobacterium SKYG29]MDW8421893.1 photosystem II protein PsbQ [Pseudanabaenaceae cyanobacterium SKYGB_i_bin29]
MKRIILLLVALVCWMGLWSPVPSLAANSRLEALATQMQRLQTFVEENNWQEIRAYIRGPMGETRRKLAAIERELPKNQRSVFKTASSKFLDDLITLDFAALQQDAERTETAFQTLQADLDSLRQTVD